MPLLLILSLSDKEGQFKDKNNYLILCLNFINLWPVGSNNLKNVNETVTFFVLSKP